MPRSLTPAERLAAADKDIRLDDIVARTGDWDRFIVEQAVWHFGLANDTFDCNQLRDVLPELSHGYLGAAINSLRTAGVIEHTGQMVPSTSGPTHGHRISVWRLSVKGLVIAETRAARPKEAAA
ncbi:hypothetical protein [Streptomyces natalensis]|uniref:Uncharacterized protein n=1 Tax=Streptomyces natalensis ATCC 27448 TaxID=1240678 RepID=A0A0D7CM10_9ACTN|nr:hypothetical protein [Streptomyces natalensis]KIZ16895.1 hypothetical protein SNA_18135 [Streptomyces natalensis ATCC 27448]